jgi:diacylglycerol kinase
MNEPHKIHPPLSTRLHNAWRGIVFFFADEYGRFTPLIFIVIGGFIWIVEPTRPELLVLLLAIGSSIALGMFNMVVEELCNLYSTEYNQKIKLIKDLAAGACVFYALVVLVLFILIAL